MAVDPEIQWMSEAVKGTPKWKEKTEKIKRYRAEASRLSTMANKRIARLESNDFTNSPAYKQFLEGGGARFGVRGKTYNEVQSEVARLNKFLGSTTSTVRGATKTLKQMAVNTNIKYKNMKDLKKKSAKFFELVSKVEQYLRNVDDIASAIGYQKIWEAVNTYTDNMQKDFDDVDGKLDGMIEKITDSIKEYETPVKFGGDWYVVDKEKE